MNQLFHKLRLFLCFFSGEDDYIIRKCEKRIQFSFASIGLFVLLIFIGCWASATLFMSHLFKDSILMSVFVGIIWAMLVTNIYLLLLYTISPAILPIATHTSESKGLKKVQIDKHESAFTSSLILRLSLITLLAIIITQPFNVLIFSPSFEESNLYAKEIRSILSTHPLAWLTTILGSIVFMLPIYWKYAIRNRGGFYDEKRKIENQLVLDNYKEFKNIYAATFNKRIIEYNRKTWNNMSPLLNKLEKINGDTFKLIYEDLSSEILNESVTKYEYWIDHPFRTVKKISARNLASEKDFLKSIYPETI